MFGNIKTCDMCFEKKRVWEEKNTANSIYYI